MAEWSSGGRSSGGGGGWAWATAEVGRDGAADGGREAVRDGGCEGAGEALDGDGASALSRSGSGILLGSAREAGRSGECGTDPSDPPRAVGLMRSFAVAPLGDTGGVGAVGGVACCDTSADGGAGRPGVSDERPRPNIGREPSSASDGSLSERTRAGSGRADERSNASASSDATADRLRPSTGRLARAIAMRARWTPTADGCSPWASRR